jgi:hypothetical protein
MPSTYETARAELTAEQRGVLAGQHPNKLKMEAAVSRWISEAQGRADGATLLRKKALSVENDLRILGDPMLRTPPCLVGLHAGDLIGAAADLRVAARDLGKTQRRAA